jgi:hypothetical protein
MFLPFPFVTFYYCTDMVYSQPFFIILIIIMICHTVACDSPAISVLLTCFFVNVQHSDPYKT